MNEPKFKPNTGYTKAQIEQAAGSKSTINDYHGTISAVDDWLKEGFCYYCEICDDWLPLNDGPCSHQWDCDECGAVNWPDNECGHERNER
jgi:hypothetical protein